VLVILTAILTSISSMIPKYIEVKDLDLDFFIVASFFFGIFFSTIGYYLHKSKTKRVYETHGLIKFSILT